jgi:2,4-dienoyl-CoA reductase-like NADH-dependent reductase (Old Yellow Enzyme family)
MLIQNLNDLQDTIRELGLAIPLSGSLPLLAEPVQTGARTLPNRLSIQPMEGCDANPDDGSPGEMTLRRYERFARGGAGLIWVEAVAVVPEGRANPRHLWIHEGNVEAFRGLVDKIREAARERTGQSPVVIIQLTHAGRFSKPEGMPAPRIACHHADTRRGPPDSGDLEPVTDEELDARCRMLLCARHCSPGRPDSTVSTSKVATVI